MTWPATTEHERLLASQERRADWKAWGPYVADRAWGTVREDYSENGDAWQSFPHEHADRRAYRWNEDGLAGFCNRTQDICLALALWNEKDPILKERYFGLSGPQGNHGEDVKEYYFFLDATPTHTYMKMLYKYPQVEYPYRRLVESNRTRPQTETEYELEDAIGKSLRAGRYFDVFVEYAKAGEEDILCRITAVNRGKKAAPLHLLPHVWFRNTWSWGDEIERPHVLERRPGVAELWHPELATRYWYASDPDGTLPTLLFTENETNNESLYGQPNRTPYVKDGIQRYVVDEQRDAVNPQRRGTKLAAHFRTKVPAGESYEVWVRFRAHDRGEPFVDFENVFTKRIAEANEFYAATRCGGLSDDEMLVQRQAFAGLLWTKQFYHYAVDRWLKGDPNRVTPPASRLAPGARNTHWRHLANESVISMPDKWEYPWYAAWDLAFHCIPLALIDPEWAKRQLVLMLREWYMHPNGQIPAYEWNFADVNPPVHAWASWRVYKISRNLTGKTDTEFLEKVFHKLLLNFTWWVNRKDTLGNNIFEGGFLGLDNIGVFDRSAPLPQGTRIEQADATAWMAMYCLNMLAMALELARTKPAYEDVASKFFEHFVYITYSLTHFADDADGLWDEEDGFFYDRLRMAGGSVPVRVRSFVGLIPLFAVETFTQESLNSLPAFRRRVNWFLEYRPQLVEAIGLSHEPNAQGRYLVAVADRPKLERVLERMLSPEEFLSDYGLRSMSRAHAAEPFVLDCNGETHSVAYEPGESHDRMFGGNSNWRGPIWFPMNYLMIESLQKYHYFYGDELTVPMPAPGGQRMDLALVARDLSRRLSRLFLRDETAGGRRPVFGTSELFQTHDAWHDNVLFYEYFHGEDGTGLGASHQTGWTALVAKLIQQSGGCLT